MKRIEVHIAEGEATRRLGTLEYDELRGKEISSSLTLVCQSSPSTRFLPLQNIFGSTRRSPKLRSRAFAPPW